MKPIRRLFSILQGAATTRREPRAATSQKRRCAWATGLLAAFPIMMAGQAQGAVTMRVDALPIDEPVRAYVTVTDDAGDPVSGLAADAFTVTVDGVPIAAPTVTLPPEVSDQRVSVVFAMDYSGSVQVAARDAMEAAVSEFIDTMSVGDYAGILKFNITNPNQASMVQPFTAIDGAGNTALLAAVTSDYPGAGTNLFDAVVLATQQFTAPPVPLPPGPKAIILVSDGGENRSTADINEAVAAANAAGVTVFTIGIGNVSPSSILNALAVQTGGTYYPTVSDEEISEAYLTISQLLNNEYLISFDSAINDCAEHTLEVSVAGQAAPASADFTRCAPVLAPDLRNLTQAQATTALTDLGLTLGTVTQRNHATVDAGLVMGQTPPAGTEVSPGSAVNIVVSLGPVQVTVPDVVGKTQAEASTMLTAAGLTVGTVTQASSSTVGAGSVISQSPNGGASADEGSSVNLTISSGPAKVTVPNVVGQTQSAATTALTGVGLTVGTVTQQASSSVAAGSVISQTPASGSSVDAGSAVSLVVSSGKPPSSGGGGGATGPFMVLGVMLLGLVRNRRRRT